MNLVVLTGVLMFCYTSGPNEALVKSGACLSRPLITPGGFVFALPCCQQVDRLDLNVMTIQIHTPNVYSKEGVAISVSATAQIKISKFPEALVLAAGQFLGKNQEQITVIAQRTFEGHQRAIIGTLTIEEIYRDRQKFNHTVREVAGVDVGNLGLEIVSFTIKGVEDSEGYLEALGKKRIAEVKRDARIGEALADRDAGVRQSSAINEQMNAFYASETAIADSKREFEIKTSEFDLQVNCEKAKASLAGELSAAKVNQRIKEETMQIEIIERNKLIDIEEQQVILAEKKLEVAIKKPAEAEKFRLETIADGVKLSVMKEAEGVAKCNELVGLAEAEVIKATGEAEAEKMQLKAEAWKSYSEGAYMEMLITKLPLIAAEIARPLCNTDTVTMITSGEAEIGAAKMTKEMMEQLPPMIQSLTGIDLNLSMDRASKISNGGNAVKVIK